MLDACEVRSAIYFGLEYIEDGNREMVKGWIQEGRTQVGGRAEGRRRQDGKILLKGVFNWNAESEIQEYRFKKFRFQIV
jgi:hypothetical protein